MGVWALALVIGHLLAVAMAWSPGLHHWAHGDSTEPHHACAIAAVITGQIDLPEAFDVIVTPPLLAERPLAFFETGRPPLATTRDSGRERAPPMA